MPKKITTIIYHLLNRFLYDLDLLFDVFFCLFFLYKICFEYFQLCIELILALNILWGFLDWFNLLFDADRHKFFFNLKTSRLSIIDVFENVISFRFFIDPTLTELFDPFDNIKDFFIFFFPLKRIHMNQIAPLNILFL